MPDEIFSDTLGSRVKFYRERLGISQDELATRVGAAQQAGCECGQDQVAGASVERIFHVELLV